MVKKILLIINLLFFIFIWGIIAIQRQSFIGEIGISPLPLLLIVFVTKPSPKNRGGSRGGKILEDKIRLNHISGWTNRFINLNSDLMWLYGLVVAEGSKKGITLNINENDLSEKAINIYKNIFNKESFIYKNKKEICKFTAKMKNEQIVKFNFDEPMILILTKKSVNL